MSKLPWEQPGQKKEQDSSSDTSTPAAGAPPFAAGAPIPDLFQKAFSETVIQETSISPLPQENTPYQPPSNITPPLFSMEMPDLNSLQSNQKPSNDPLSPFIPGGNKESLPPFLSQASEVASPEVTAPDVKNLSKAQTAKKKQLPLFEIALPDDGTKGGSSTTSVNDAATLPFLSGFSTPGPKLDEPGMPNLPLFVASAEHSISSPLTSNTPVLGGITPPSQNTAPASVEFSPFSSNQASMPSTSPAEHSGSGNPFDLPQSGSVTPAFSVGPSPFDVPGNSPFSGPSSSKDPFSSAGNPFGIAPASSPLSGSSPFPATSPSVDPFSASVDPFAKGPVSQVADPFAGQTNPFGAGFVPEGPNPFSPSGAISPFPPGPISIANTNSQEKKAGISEKMAGVSGNLVAGISEFADSIVSNLRNLTKGKSLMEKMEKIKEGNNREGDDSLRLSGTSEYGYKKEKVKVNGSTPFSDESPFDSELSGTSPFAPNGSADKFSIPPSAFSNISTEDTKVNDNVPNDFMKVTPIENPLFDFPEALKIENNLQTLPPTSNDSLEGAKGGANGNKDELKPLKNQGNMDPETFSLPASMVQRPSSALYNPIPVPKKESASESSGDDGSILYMSKELEDVKEKLELSAGNVSQVFSMFEELSGNVNVLGDSVKSLQSSSDDVMKATGMKFDSLDERVGQLESRFSGIEQQVSQVQSENKNIISSLSSIEQHISELVESYSALVSKMQETSQETDERFSVLSGKIGSMEGLIPRIATIEKSGAETSDAVQDMAGNVSKLAIDVSSVSASQQQVREEMAELSKYVEGELKKIGARGYKVAGQSIQLAHIMKNSTSIKLCMEWLEFLMELVGRNNLPDILSYYEELGWITEEVRLELMRYAEGIDFYMEKPDWKLTPDDHVKSIWFIENLAGIKVDKNKLSIIDRDIDKVRKSSEMYNI
jgi:archaellum component FlaD/FlaE